MKLRWMAATGIVVLLGSASCKSKGHGHSDDGPGHGDHGSHGHGHEEEALPQSSATVWTESAELFLEGEPLIVGRETKLDAYLTRGRGDDSAPVDSGSAMLTLSVGAKVVNAEAAKLARRGVFSLVVTPKVAGECTLRFSVRSGDGSESFAVPNCVVFADEAAARASMSEAESQGSITFHKEQQWQIGLDSASASREEIVPSKTVNATIKVVPGRAARLTAGTSGRLSLEDPVPTLGSQVRKGQLLARIQPTVSAPGSVGTLRADVAAAKAEEVAAKASFERLERLVASDSVPKRRLEEAASTLEVARARLSAAKTRLSSYAASASGSARPGAGAFRVTSPIAGTVVEQSVTEGETTTAGELLFSVVDLERVWVEGRIFEPDVPDFEKSKTAWFTVDGRDTVFDVNEDSGKLVTVGHVLDPSTRTLPVIFEVHNPEQVLRIGQYAKLSVATGKAALALVIPESAVLRDGTQTVVFVQSGAETFQRRVVQLGTHSRGLVEVLRGVEEDERVVTKGAYDIKLASAANSGPAHGHSH